MNNLLLAGILGAIGGLARATVGLLKAMQLKRKILWGYWLVTIAIAVIIGVCVGVIFEFNPVIAVLGGYAGTDVIESIYKAFSNQKVIIKEK